MASVTCLTIGTFEVDWGMHHRAGLHWELFQPSDAMLVDDIFVGDDGEYFTESKPGASKALRDILPRLELLGYTLSSAREEFEFQLRTAGVEESPITFDQFANALKSLDVEAAPVDYDEDYDLGEFFALSIFDRIGLGRLADRSGVRFDLGVAMENLSPCAVLRLLAENPNNLRLPVVWHYSELVDEGWIDADKVVASLGSARRYLIVTEGSSDAHILRRALELLRPATADFFTFIDMEEGYPFTGTGNLHKFCQGLVAIGIENRVVVLYDNDLEGSLKCEDTRALNLPANMRVTKLPSLPVLDSFRVIGPEGVGTADINGRAASIECYLDLGYGTEELPSVRWSTFVEKADGYQGALMYKETYSRRFLKLRHRDPDYDFSKLEAVLDHLFEVSSRVAETTKAAERAYEMGKGSGRTVQEDC